MTALDTKLRLPPRWKEIFDQVQTELPAYTYGSSFYTITDICDKFHVSRITAIRVLNELAARSLIEKIPGKGNVVRAMNKPASIRLIIPNAARKDYIHYDPVNRRLVDGVAITSRSQSLDFDTISESHLQSLFPRQDAAFGFLVPKMVTRQTIEFLRTHDLPHVFLDPIQSGKQQNHARVDRVQAGYLATKHLLELGHRRIAWITGYISDANFRDRIKGYRKALRETRITFDWQYIRETQGAVQEMDIAALESLMLLTRPPTAIILGDDSRGVHVAAACRAKGIRIPEDLSLVGYPNNPESSLTLPPLTVVDTHFEQVGEASVKVLLQLMLEHTRSKSVQIMIEPKLVLRSSTAPPRMAITRQEKLNRSSSHHAELVPLASGLSDDGGRNLSLAHSDTRL